MYDLQTREAFQYNVYNGDFSTQRRIDMMTIGKNGNADIAFCQKINAEVLVDAYNKSQLKGKLKEIASKLEEDSNAVIILGKYKK